MLKWLKRLFGIKNKQEEDGRFHCTYCGGTEFYKGPQGGLSTNICCSNPSCEHWFNYHGGIMPADDLHRTGWR